MTGRHASRPASRQSYVDSAYTRAAGLRVSTPLSGRLQASRAPLTDAELGQFYMPLLDKGQLPAVRSVRQRLNRPNRSTAVTNGGFGPAVAPEPFQWRLAPTAGVIAEIVPDDLRPADPALRIEYDGFAPSRIAEQLVFLEPGRYRLTFETRLEAGDPGDRMAWTLTCAPGDQAILRAPSATTGATGWTPRSADFTVPSACAAQWLRLETRPGDRRANVVAWFDRVAIAPVSTGLN